MKMVDNMGTRVVGLFLVVAGIAAGVYGFTMATSVGSPIGRVNNIGLLHDQSMVYIGAGISFLVGSLILAFAPEKVKVVE